MDQLHHGNRIILRDLLRQLLEDLRIRRANGGKHPVQSKPFSEIVGHTFVQYGQGITHGTVRRTGDIVQRIPVRFHFLPLQKILHPVGNGGIFDPPEIIPLAPGTYRYRNLVRLGGGKDKDHIGRRLLQCLQHGIEGTRGEHMHLVYDIYHVFPVRGSILHSLIDLTDILYTVIGSGIDLQYIHGRSGSDPPAAFTFAAGTAFHRMFAVHGLGQKLGHGGLSRTSGSTEQIGMSDPVVLYLILQSCNYRFLSFYFLKGVRTELSIQRYISHFFVPFACTHPLQIITESG